MMIKINDVWPDTNFFRNYVASPFNIRKLKTKLTKQKQKGIAHCIQTIDWKSKKKNDNLRNKEKRNVAHLFILN